MNEVKELLKEMEEDIRETKGSTLRDYCIRQLRQALSLFDQPCETFARITGPIDGFVEIKSGVYVTQCKRCGELSPGSVHLCQPSDQPAEPQAEAGEFTKELREIVADMGIAHMTEVLQACDRLDQQQQALAAKDKSIEKLTGELLLIDHYCRVNDIDMEQALKGGGK